MGVSGSRFRGLSSVSSKTYETQPMFGDDSFLLTAQPAYSEERRRTAYRRKRADRTRHKPQTHYQSVTGGKGVAGRGILGKGE
jgi:hypothetical protein